MTLRTRIRLALGAAITLAAAACSGASGPGPDESASANVSPAIFTDTPSSLSFADPVRVRRPVFEVEADDPEYWRMFTLDVYDGLMWRVADRDGSEIADPLATPATLPAPGDGSWEEAQTLDQTFRILKDLPRSNVPMALPMAHTAEKIVGPFGNITWDPEGSIAFIEGNLEAGTTYTVRSRIVVPTPEELDRADSGDFDRSIPERWTALPAGLDPRIPVIAERWTADATTDYRKVLAIQQRFQEGDFVYSTGVDPRVNIYTLVDFLTRTKTGFCVHYSTAMALMVRTLGLPSRIGVGFRAGTRQSDGSYLVTTEDAHVWVEVLFPGYGWLQFEPEHGAVHPNAEPGTYLNPRA